MAQQSRAARPRAFRVLGPDGEVGLLGEGAGPFITAVLSDLPDPVLSHVRFTSLSVRHEDEIARLLVGTKSFDDARAGLEGRGLKLEPVEYALVFQPLTAVAFRDTGRRAASREGRDD